MNIDIYESPFITANSAISFINPLPIMNYCHSLEEELEILQMIKQRLLEAKSYTSKENFYVEGIDIEDRLEINTQHLQSVIFQVEDYIGNVQTALTKAIDEKQMELNEQAKREELLAQGGQAL